MKIRSLTGILAGALTLGIASPVLAHHSHAMFDHTKDVVLTGTVTAFEFVNPHASLYIDAKNEKGEMVNYWFEMSNVPNMVTRGIGKTTFKYGETVTVKFHPLKDGRPGGNYVSITMPDGKFYD
jgi:hypothetical protein